jgi:hypothetical protein
VGATGTKIDRYMRAIQKVTSGELLTKQIYLLYTKSMYLLKVFLSIVTAGIEAIVTLGSKFLCSCVKDACHL